MLNGTLTLHNIPDVEHFAEQRARRWQHKHRITLQPADHEDLTAYLIETTWQLSTRFDPTRNDSFANYAGPLLLLRATDWARKRYGRTRWQHHERWRTGRTHDTHERTHPDLVALDTDIHRSSHPPDSSTTLERLLQDRTRHRTTDLSALDQRVPHRTTT